ncbi:MAG TPA: response regulator [Terriglobales bacterium]|jgi:CheY-like chemotaxis protein
MNRPKVLCVDDDPGIRHLYDAFLKTHGYQVLLAASGQEALRISRVRSNDIAAVITDYEMPGMNGYELASQLKQGNPKLPILMIAGNAPQMDDPPVDGSLTKGASIHEIAEAIEELMVRVQSQPGWRPALLPLGSALAAVTMVAFLLSRLAR